LYFKSTPLIPFLRYFGMDFCLEDMYSPTCSILIVVDLMGIQVFGFTNKVPLSQQLHPPLFSRFSVAVESGSDWGAATF